jgi:hypothetical protein
MSVRNVPAQATSTVGQWADSPTLAASYWETAKVLLACANERTKLCPVLRSPDRAFSKSGRVP